MSVLVPRNHVPVSLAVVHLIALAINEQTNKVYDEETGELLYGERGYFDGYFRPHSEYIVKNKRFREGIERIKRDIVCVSVDLVLNHKKPKNPYDYDAVKMVFRDEYDEPFSKPAEEASWGGLNPYYHLFLTLRPPFDTCLSPDNIERSIEGGLIRAVSPLPEGFRLVFSDLTHDTCTRYRQALADGTLLAFALEDSGHLRTVPKHFWRSKGAEQAFYNNDPITFDDDGKTISGIPLVNILDLVSSWHPALCGSEVETKPRTAVRSFGPYLDFLLHVANKLDMVDGRDKLGNKIVAKDIATVINREWPKPTKKNPNTPNIHNIGAWSANKVNMMVTMLRHPDLERGGNTSKEDRAASEAARNNATGQA